MIDLPAVQDLIARWWFEYDHGAFESWSEFFTADARFECRTDSGQTDFEEFVRADLRGRDAVVAWHVDHRRNSPYPLRHYANNVHLVAVHDDGVDFRSYLLCTHVSGGAVANLASGVVAGTVREEHGSGRFSVLTVVLDFTDSRLFSEVR